MALDLRIEEGDIREFPADVVVLKHAQAFHGADQAIVLRLAAAGVVNPATFRLEPGHTTLLPTHGTIRASNVLLVGTPDLWGLNYDAVHDLAATAFRALRDVDVPTRHVALTLHGPGVGLDEIEALLSLFTGINAALAEGPPPGLQRISIVERHPERVRRLSIALRTELRAIGAAATSITEHGTGWSFGLDEGRDASTRQELPVDHLESKKRVFVAMPFAEELEDLFYYGIQDPVRRVGCVCERMDKVSFTGDILSAIKQRIASSELMIGVLTGANPNVYLEIGYAWGTNVPTVLVLHGKEEAHFDVQGQRCLIYSQIHELDKRLEQELRALLAA